MTKRLLSITIRTISSKGTQRSFKKLQKKNSLVAEHSSELSCLAFARVVLQLIYVSAMNIFTTPISGSGLNVSKTNHLQSPLSLDCPQSIFDSYLKNFTAKLDWLFISASEFARRKIGSLQSTSYLRWEFSEI